MDEVWRWWAATVAVVLCAVAIWLGPGWLHLQGDGAFAMRGTLAVVGGSGLAAFVWTRIARRKKPPAGPADSNGDPVALDAEVKHLLGVAQGELRSVRGKNDNLLDLPSLLLIGAKASGKTTILKNSGLSTTALASQSLEGDEVPPTRALNVQLAGDFVVIDVGAPVFADRKAWSRLCRSLTRPSLRTLIGIKQPPHRAVLVTVSCELFGPQEAGTASVAAVALRNQIDEFVRRAGDRVSVYLVFSHAEKIKHFTEFFQELTEFESERLLGKVFNEDLNGTDHVRIYRDKVKAVYLDMADRLRSERFVYLPRHRELKPVQSGYEFPRELAKYVEAIVDFVTAVCPATSFHRRPRLRGFFFTGVRLWGRPAHSHEVTTAGPRATQVIQFGAGGMTRPTTAGAIPTVQHMFIPTLLRDVIASDLTSHGRVGKTKVSLYRRVIAAALLMCAVTATLFVAGSYGNNKTMIAAVESAAKTSDLQSLVKLRQQIDAIHDLSGRWAFDSSHWGLFAGEPLSPEANRIYARRFREELLNPLRDRLAGQLNSLPSTRTVDGWRQVYPALKEYLVITTNHDKAAPTLADYTVTVLASDRNWSTAERGAVAGEFRYYFDRLAADEQWLAPGRQPEVIERARMYLNGFSAPEQLYGMAASNTAEKAITVPYNDAAVKASLISGLFTKEGKAGFDAALQDYERRLAAEAWVLGPGLPSVSGARGGAEKMYAENMVREWKEFLKTSEVLKFGDAKGASKQLDVLARTNAGVFGLFCRITQNTAGEDLFSPAAQACDGTDTAAQRQSYVTALTSAQQAASNLADAPEGSAERAAAVARCNDAVGGLQTAARVFSNALKGPDQVVLAKVVRLIEQPGEYAKPVCGNRAGPGPGQQFCKAYSGITGKFPFNSQSRADVTDAELDAIFNRRTGELAKLAAAVVQQGTTQLPPKFKEFYAELQKFGAALYASGPSPTLTFTMRPFSRPDWYAGYQLAIQGHRIEEASPTTQIAVPHDVSQLAQLVRRSQEPITEPYSGMWAALRLAQSGTAKPVSTGTYRVEFLPKTAESAPAGQQPVVFEVSLPPDAPNFLSKQYFKTLRNCAP